MGEIIGDFNGGAGLTAAQRNRIAFPRRWIDVGKKAKHLRAVSRRHGPDEWPIEVDVNGTDARDTLDKRTLALNSSLKHSVSHHGHVRLCNTPLPLTCSTVDRRLHCKIISTHFKLR